MEDGTTKRNIQIKRAKVYIIQKRKQLRMGREM